MTRLVAIFIALCIAGCCCPSKSKAEIEKDKAAQEARKAQEAREKAELEALKKKCGPGWGSSEWVGTCQDLVRARLFQPSSADFSILWDVARDSNKTACTMWYSSTVESRNAFGATIKHRFKCTYDVKRNRVTLDFITMA